MCKHNQAEKDGSRLGLTALLRKWLTPSPDPFVEIMREQMKANQEMVRDITTSMSALAEAQTAQAKSFTDYLSLFATDGQPLQSRVIRDEDELRWELERNGFPTDSTPQEQAQWVLDNT